MAELASGLSSILERSTNPAVSVGAAARHLTTTRRLAWLSAAATMGFLIAGFWNVQFVDGLGLTVFVRPTIGEFEGRAAAFEASGAGFGFIFASVAGLAATWTASNAASLTMLPLLANASEGRMRDARRLAVLVAGSAAVVGGVYGIFVGRLGPEGAAAFNASPIRSGQSFTVFGAIGICLIAGALAEIGLLRKALHLSPITRAFFAQPSTRAVLCGLAIGLFSIGRPLAVYREMLLYAAQPARPIYAALVMGLAAIATTIVPLLLLLAGTYLYRDRIKAAIARGTSDVIAPAALAGGGVFLLFYWCFSRVWPTLGRWGFTLGIYG